MWTHFAAYYIISRMSKLYTKLDIGGSSGSKKGKFYESHFHNILQKIGYSINGIKDKKLEHLHRLPPDKFTEIDFYIPEKKVGFCVTNLSQKKRFRVGNKKINEFDDLVGLCPHCRNNFKNENTSSYWVCQNCNQLILPFDLINPKTKSNMLVNEVEDLSAIQQAHKQAYYRIGELIDVKVNDEEIKLVEIIYNSKDEWRYWSKAIDFFYDDCVWVFSEFTNHKFGSQHFEKEFMNRIKNIINSRFNNEKNKQFIIKKFIEIKNSQKTKYKDWIKNFSNSRLSSWKKDEPISYPVRYSVYDLILKNGEIKNNIDVNIIKHISKFRSGKITKKEIQFLKENNFLDIKKNKLNLNAIEVYKSCIESFKQFINKIENSEIIIDNEKDFWNISKKIYILEMLNYLLKISLKNNWYKFAMISRNDINQLNNTPYIDSQYEPLELLLRVKIEKLLQKGIIKKIYGEIGRDYREKSWLSDILQEEIRLGSDFVIKLKNDKILNIQCKSNTSFKKWLLDKSIKNSGITYKDTKRMIAHNMLTSFEFVNNKLQFKNQRNYIGVIDGNWTSNKSDKYKLIRMMFLMGVDDIFFSDEIDDKFEDYIIKLSS